MFLIFHTALHIGPTQCIKSDRTLTISASSITKHTEYWCSAFMSFSFYNSSSKVSLSSYWKGVPQLLDKNALIVWLYRIKIACSVDSFLVKNLSLRLVPCFTRARHNIVMRSSGISQNSLMWHFQFSIWSAHLEMYILLKTPLESVQWFQGYEQLKGSQNNRKQKKFTSFSGYISPGYLTINAADFRLIPLDRNTIL